MKKNKDEFISYRNELFEKLKKSLSLKKEEDCFKHYLDSCIWWMTDKVSHNLPELRETLVSNCPYLRRSPSKCNTCLAELRQALLEAKRKRKIKKIVCANKTYGFVYPIVQGGTLYGYIGACNAKKEPSPELLDIFSSFTNTVLKEAQKELELSKLYESIRPRAIALSTVHTVHRLISSTLDLGELLPRIARLSLQIMRANRCSIKLLDHTKKVLLPKTTVDIREKKSKLKKVRIGRWAPGKAVKQARSIRGEDYLAVPLIDEDVIGVITLYDKVDKKPFTAFDQEVMSTLAEQAVIAIKNAQLYKEQEKLTLGGIRSIAALLNTRAAGVYVPRASFLRITLTVGQAMRLNEHELKSLEYASLLHDAGQVVVPDEVLAKPAKLTGKEYELIKEHPLRGVKIIKPMRTLKSVIPIILHHHENYDGSGYPKGLKGEQIPLEARIMAVVGAFEAMIGKRPYRKARTMDEAIQEIESYSGTQFDPKVVGEFLKVVNRRDIRVMLEREAYEPK